MLVFSLAGCGKSREEKRPAPIIAPPLGDAGGHPRGLFQVTSACALPYRMTIDAPTTWRLPFTNMRPGDRVQLAFWGHWSPATLRSAWFGRFVGGGEVEGAVQLTFDGARRVELADGVPVLCDPFDYPMRRGERYAVSFSAVGSVPEGLDFEGDGLSAPGDLAREPVLEGSPDWRVHGVKWVAVEGEAQRVLAVLGDSIGAGQSAQRAEQRFIEVAQMRLGHPVVDASVGGDGIERALNRLERDVFELPGVTDCLVQLGTNDLHREDPGFLIDGLCDAFGRLRAAGIRPWAATIMPKPGHLTEAGEQTRREVNVFLRSTRLIDGYADFDLAIRDPADPANARPGMLADGIHPTSAGHAELADALVRALGRSR